MIGVLWITLCAACQSGGCGAPEAQRREVDVKTLPFEVERAPTPGEGWADAYDVALAVHIRGLGTDGVERIRLSPLTIDGSMAPYFVRIERTEAGGVGDGAMLVHEGHAVSGRGGAPAASDYLGAIGFPAQTAVGEALSAGMLARLLAYFGALPDDLPRDVGYGPPRMSLTRRAEGATLTLVGKMPGTGGTAQGLPPPVERQVVVRFDAMGRIVE